MATLGTIQADVSKRLLDPNNQAVSLSDVTAAINAAIGYWKFRRFWFNEVHDTGTLTAESPEFPYPSDFLVPAIKDDGFYISYSGLRYPLKKVTRPVFDATYLSNGYGLPSMYARIADDEYQCYPIPDRDYTVGRHYLKDYIALSSTSDTNDFTNYASRLVTLWSLADISAELRQDDKMESYYRNAAEDQYRSLSTMTSKTNSTGSLTLYM